MEGPVEGGGRELVEHGSILPPTPYKATVLNGQSYTPSTGVGGQSPGRATRSVPPRRVLARWAAAVERSLGAESAANWSESAQLAPTERPARAQSRHPRPETTRSCTKDAT